MRQTGLKRWGVRIVCVLVLAGSSAVALPAGAASPAASPTAPTVSLTLPPNHILHGGETFTATATATRDQRNIVSVDFQYSPAGANTWTTFDCWSTAPDPTCTAQRVGNTYTGLFNSPPSTNGVYDFRAEATDNTGESAPSAIAPNLIVAVNAAGIDVANPGSPLSGTVTLTADTEPIASPPGSMTFEICPAAAHCPANGNWQSLATVVPDADGNGGFKATTTLNTKDAAALGGGDGTYDISVSATPDEFGDPFVGGLVSHVVVDNTSPTVTLDRPAASLSGVANLSASAQDAGSGVAAVRFEVAPAGTANWTTVGVASGPTYSASFDTRQFDDGSYDVRAEATDSAGNTAASAPVPGVAISNPGAQRFGGLTITNFVAPATNIKLLGELPGSQHETWAIGQSNGELVVLKYTDDSGWQIVDDHLFQLPSGVQVTYAGAMASSGEAWIALRAGQGQSVQFAMWHRLPDGQFQSDQNALTAPLEQFIGRGTLSMRLHQNAGGVFGLLLTSAPPTTTFQNGPIQGSVSLGYGALIDGSWTVQGTSLPQDYTPSPGENGLTQQAVDVTGPGQGWAVFQQTGSGGNALVLARFDQSGWTFRPQTGLDAFDLTGPFAAGSQQSVATGGNVQVTPQALSAGSSGVWVSANVSSGGSTGQIVARVDGTSATGGQCVVHRSRAAKLGLHEHAGPGSPGRRAGYFL